MADSLTFYYSLPAADSTAVWGREAQNPAEIFGPLSTSPAIVTTSTIAIIDDADIPISWQSGVILIILLTLLCYGVYRFGTLIRVSFKSIFAIEDTISMFENPTIEFSYYVVYGRAMFVLSTSIIIAAALADRSEIGIWAIPIIMAVMITGSSLSRCAAKLLSFFDYDGGRWEELQSIKKIDRTIAGIIFAVPTIAFSHVNVIQTTLLVMVGGVTVAHFLRILIFFKRRGFSFLQWFLYLCTVEIAPFALLWGVASRLNGIHF